MIKGVLFLGVVAFLRYCAHRKMRTKVFCIGRNSLLLLLLHA
jgi:hypothetical protein